jgi:hypothetical protein
MTESMLRLAGLIVARAAPAWFWIRPPVLKAGICACRSIDFLASVSAPGGNDCCDVIHGDPEIWADVNLCLNEKILSRLDTLQKIIAAKSLGA